MDWVIENDFLKVKVDSDYPLIRQYLYKPTGGVLSGHLDKKGEVWCEGKIKGEKVSFPLEIKKQKSKKKGTHCWYYGEAGLENNYCHFVWHIYLNENEVEWRIERIEERGFELEKVHFPRCHLLSLTSTTAGARVIWNNAIYDLAKTELREEKNVVVPALNTKKVIATLYTPNFYMSGPWRGIIREKEGEKISTLSPETFVYRIKDKVLPSLAVRIAILGDLNQDKKIDWLDAALWLNRQLPQPYSDLYARAHISKDFLCEVPNKVHYSLAELKKRMIKLYHLTLGRKQIYYLVGFQYEGHDSKFPSLDKVNQAIGGREQLLDLMNTGKKYNTIVSFHTNFDDAYLDSPDWDERIICRAENGELQKGGVWGGGQSYVISPYKSFKTGFLQKMTRQMLKLYPDLKETIHPDVFSAVPERFSYDQDDPSDHWVNFYLGKKKIIEYYRKLGLDLTSEWTTYPFVGFLSYYWHSGLATPSWPPVLTAFLHGKIYYGGWKPELYRQAKIDYIPEYLTFGSTIDKDFTGETRLETILDVYYLLNEIWFLYNRLPMTFFENKKGVARVRYGENIWVTWHTRQNTYQVTLDGELVARNFVSFIPRDKNKYILYSAGRQEISFPLPQRLQNKKFVFQQVTETGKRIIQKFKIKSGRIKFLARAHTPYLLTVK